MLIFLKARTTSMLVIFFNDMTHVENGANSVGNDKSRCDFDSWTICFVAFLSLRAVGSTNEWHNFGLAR